MIFIMNIYIYQQGVIITDDFKAYIGKVQLDDGTIIDIPPLSFKNLKKIIRPLYFLKK